MKRLYITGAVSLASMAMFAAAKDKGSAPAPTPVNASGYAFEEFELPPTTRGGAAGDKGGSKIATALAEVPMGKSFLEQVEVPESITDAAEREKAFKDMARKLTNKIGGTIRRHRKSNPLHNFALRTVNDDKLGRGVRVWRVADSEPQASGAGTPPPPPPAPVS